MIIPNDEEVLSSSIHRVYVNKDGFEWEYFSIIHLNVETKEITTEIEKRPVGPIR